MDAVVDVAEYLGADTFLVLDAGSVGQITARVIGDAALRPGAKVGLSFPPEVLHFFNVEGLRIDG